MSRRNIIGYTGKSKPPFFEMTLKASSKTTPVHDLDFTVILDGFDESNNRLPLSRKAEIVGGKFYNSIYLFIVTSRVVFSCSP